MPIRDPAKKKAASRRYYLKYLEQYKAKTRARYRANPLKTRNYLLQKKFGITIEQYNRNHDTGEIRGMLCDACNCALGLLRDSPELLEGLVRYLRFFRSRGSLSAM